MLPLSPPLAPRARGREQLATPKPLKSSACPSPQPWMVAHAPFMGGQRLVCPGVCWRKDAGSVPGCRKISAAALRARISFCSSAVAGSAQHAVAGPGTTQRSSLRGHLPMTFTGGGLRGVEELR